MRQLPSPTLFPYTTLFRSRCHRQAAFFSLSSWQGLSLFLFALGRVAAQTRIRIAPAKSLDRKSTRLNSSHTVISYAVFCLKKKKTKREGISRNAGARRA